MAEPPTAKVDDPAEEGPGEAEAEAEAEGSVEGADADEEEHEEEDDDPDTTDDEDAIASDGIALTTPTTGDTTPLTSPPLPTSPSGEEVVGIFENILRSEEAQNNPPPAAKKKKVAARHSRPPAAAAPADLANVYAELDNFTSVDAGDEYAKVRVSVCRRYSDDLQKVLQWGQLRIDHGVCMGQIRGRDPVKIETYAQSLRSQPPTHLIRIVVWHDSGMSICLCKCLYCATPLRPLVIH
jgi:hypothetical protein